MAHHTGSCHCGAVCFAADTEITQALSCNCSICHKRGSLLSFMPAASFTLQQGEAALTDYQFNKGIIHHLFCSTCGILPFARGAMPDGTPMVALNLRCVDGLDLKTLPVVEYDGASA
ncbi:MAG TPA: GFA family protein [Roseomonas sp.]|nr:GFA family protein [Roseomonas sp.]